MFYDNHILDALETVSTWGLPEEDLADAVSDQARLMAGINADEILEDHSDNL